MMSYSEVASAADWGTASANPSVMRVQTHDVVENPEFIAFIQRACDFPWVPEWRGVLGWIRDSIEDPKAGMFVHLEEGRFDGLVFVYASDSIWSYSPAIIYAFSDNADSSARHEIGAVVYSWLSQNGFSSLIGQTVGDNSIESILTAGEAGGIAKGEVVGKLVRFRIKEK